MSKILTYIIVILTVIVAGELLVLRNFNALFSKNAGEQKNTNPIKNTPNAVPSLVSAPSAYSYWLTKKPIMTKSTKTDESEGVVTAIDAKGGSLNVNGVSHSYALKIDLQNSKGATYTFIYDTNDLKKTIIKDKVGKIEKGALQVGDTLHISEVVTLLGQSNSVLSIVITKK